jgi:flagellar biosynthesis/type III secretory pathway M-ring protein FliF/YscJ
MDNYDRFIRLVDWLALPVACLILLVLFLFFVVRPFFAYLFDPDRVAALKKIRTAQQKREETAVAAATGEEAEVEFQFKSPPLREDLQQMSRMAESDPDKAGTLVKEWLKQDKE